MKAAHHRFRRLCAIIIGIVLLCSSLLKLMDPVGTGLIVKEYLNFFHLGFIGGAAKVLGALLALFEGTVGAALITGVFRKAAATVTWALLGFFTLITLILWIANPAMDCGCFGEAIHLTHAQSFLKNIVLLVLAFGAFLPMTQFGIPFTRKKVSFALSVVALVIALWYSWKHLPLIDFTEFAPGVELYASLDNDYQKDDGLFPTLIYEKDGQQGSFTGILPDSSWSFVRADTLKRNGRYLPQSKPMLSFTDASGEYQDEKAVVGKVVLFSVYKPEKADWKRLEQQAETAKNAGAAAFVLVASDPETIDGLSVPPTLEIYYADYKTLLTLNRANGGGSYFSNGELVTKWAPCDAPKTDGMGAMIWSDPIDVSTQHVIKRRIRAQGFCLYLAALLILV